MKDNFYLLRKTKKRPKTAPRFSRHFLLILLLPGFFLLLVGLAPESGQPTKSSPPAEFIQPIEFSHKIHIEKGEIPCEFCHIYSRRSINAGAPAMASCFGCHGNGVIAGSDEKQQKAIKKVLEFQQKGASIPWKKIHDLPDFVHFSHKRHVQAGFDCTECHGEINQHDVLSIKTMINDLSMGWCIKCHREGRPTVNGKVAGPVRETRGGKILKQAAEQLPDGAVLGSTDCYTCHK